jgi:hypothetical protein
MTLGLEAGWGGEPETQIWRAKGQAPACLAYLIR